MIYRIDAGMSYGRCKRQREKKVNVEHPVFSSVKMMRDAPLGNNFLMETYQIPIKIVVL